MTPEIRTRPTYEDLCRTTDPWVDIPPRYNLGKALTRDHVEAGRGGRVCLYWENSARQARRFTYQEMDEHSSRFASALATLGVRHGDRVLLRLPNLPEFYIAALGIAKLDAIFIPTSTQFRTAEIEYRLRDSGAVAAVSTTGLVREIEAAREKAPVLKHVIVVDYPGADTNLAPTPPHPALSPGGGEGFDVQPSPGDQKLSRDRHDFWRLISDGKAAFTPADTASDDVAFIAYTSGTTGDPKGVVHYHRYPISYDSLIRWWHDYHDDDICACPSELGWLLPVASTFLYAMRMGISIVLHHAVDGRFDPAAWLRLIEKYRITNFVGTPTVYRMLAGCDRIARADLSSLRHGVSAGEPLPADTISTVKERLGFVPLDGIGMSECMVYCFNMVGEEPVPGSCGRPAPCCDIRLMDEDMNEVPVGTDGVLCLRRSTHPGMMKEYWNKREQTAEIFRGEWYYSGDVLSRDEAGRYWFKGRSDDVIKASGYRISPFEVEGCLLEHPAVLEAAAIGSPDELRGNVVKAFIVLREGFTASDALARELQEWVKGRAAPYKYPRRIEFVTEMPKTTSGKVQRRLLRAREIPLSSGESAG